MTRSILAIAMTLGATTPVLGAESPEAAVKGSIAVLPLQAKRFPAETSKVLDDLLVQAMHDVGKHQVISIGDIAAMLDAEKLKDALGCDSVRCAAEIGGALGARFLAFGTVSQLGDNVIVTLQMVDNRSGRVVNRARSTVLNDENNFQRAVDVAVRRLYNLREPDPAPSTGIEEPRDFSVGLGKVGTLVAIETTPPGAVVLMDGEFLCQDTPCSKFVEPGEHTLRLFEDDPCHFPQTHTLQVLDQSEQGTQYVGVQREAGIRVFLQDAKGNDLTGEVEVDGKVLGPVPGAYRVFACAKKVRIRSSADKVWEGTLDLEAEKTSDVRGVLSADAKVKRKKAKKEFGMQADSSVAIETYRKRVDDGSTASIPTERLLTGQVRGAVTYGALTVGGIVPYNATVQGNLPAGLGDVSLYVSNSEDDLTLAGWVRLPTADRGAATTQDARLGLTEFGAFFDIDGDTLNLGFGMTYARKLSGALDGYNRWTILANGSIDLASFAEVYAHSAFPLGSDDLDFSFDPVGLYVDTGVDLHWEFALSTWLTLGMGLDVRFSGNLPPDPPDTGTTTPVNTPARFALTFIPSLSARFFDLSYVQLSLARFRRFGVPWGLERHEGFALFQNEGLKVEPLPMMIELGVQL